MEAVVGQIYEGKVTGITKFGAFVEFNGGSKGMVHISEVADRFVEKIEDHLELNQTVKVKVISVAEDGKIALSVKRAQEGQRPQTKRPPRADNPQPKGELSFEEMMSKFKARSQEKISEINRSANRKNKTSRKGYRK